MTNAEIEDAVAEWARRRPVSPELLAADPDLMRSVEGDRRGIAEMRGAAREHLADLRRHP